MLSKKSLLIFCILNGIFRFLILEQMYEKEGRVISNKKMTGETPEVRSYKRKPREKKKEKEREHNRK